MARADEPSGGSKGPSPFSYLGLGVELVAPMIVGVLGGKWLDGRFDTAPWLTIAGALLGMAAGFLEFFRRVLQGGGTGGGGSSR